MSRTRRLYIVATLLASFALAVSAFAQGEWFETGSLTTVIDGEERLLHTYGTLVPEDVADGVEDEQQRAILERVAGTEQHTATYKFMEGISMGGITLTPDTIWLAFTFRFGGHDSSGPHGVTMQIPLDPATLEISDPDQIEVTYYPNGPSWDDFYALTEGAILLDAVDVVDDVTLRIAGSFTGTFTHQTDYDIVHNPDRALAAQGEFVVERVVGSQLALELLGGGE